MTCPVCLPLMLDYHKRCITSRLWMDCGVMTRDGKDAKQRPHSSQRYYLAL